MKIIYIPLGAAKEYFLWAANLYIGCSNNCFYCYLKHGLTKGTLGGSVPVLKKTAGKDEEEAFMNFQKELLRSKDQILSDGSMLFFSFTTDSFLKDTIDLTFKCVEFSVKNGVPVSLLTKKADWLGNEKVMSIIRKYSDLLSIGFSLTGRDDQEPEASSNQERIEAMDRLHQMGIKTWGSFEPVISIADSKRVITECFNRGCCDEYKIGLVSGVKKEYTRDEVRLFKAEIEAIGLPGLFWKKSVTDFIR